MNQKYGVLKMKHSVKNIGKFMGIFIFVCVFFHGKVPRFGRYFYYTK